MRTENEAFANDFDATLFDLIDRAAYRASGDCREHWSPKQKEAWGRLSDALRSARPIVRQMMSPNDRKDTF